MIDIQANRLGDDNSEQPRFPTGEIVITRNAAERLADKDVQTALRRHVQADWGAVCEEDWQANDHAMENSHRILSVYVAQNQTKFWIITEADRSTTTVLLPEDY
jgi:hypothetical protein